MSPVNFGKSIPLKDRPERRRADVEKDERSTMGRIPPAGIIRKPLKLPPMERVQR